MGCDDLLARGLGVWHGLRETRDRRDAWNQALQMEAWPADQVREWQLARIRALLEHAWQCSPYYHRVLNDAGIRPSDVRTLADLGNVPVLTKANIQIAHDEIVAPGVSVVENQTGGSTGQPLRFVQDADYLKWAGVSRRWAYHLCGFREGERQVFLWGSDYDSKARATRVGRLRDRLHNIRFVNAFSITDIDLRRIAYELADWQPSYIWGYASTLELLAEQVLSSDCKISPKAVQSTAGTLYPSLRSRVEQAFGKVVYDRYGCREVSIIAHECSHHAGLHECSFHNYVEIVPIPNSRYGRIVVTNLHNRAFPFIRYDTGDLAVPGSAPCACGRGFPLIERVAGRSVEVVTSPSGKLIDGEFFTHLFYHIEGVVQFQVIQESRELLRVQIVKNGAYDPGSERYLEEAIRKHGDARFQIEFEYVEHIEPFRSGKRAFVVSRVPVTLR